MKENLLKLIETYADARITNNAILIQFASQQLRYLLDSVDIILIQSEQSNEPSPDTKS